jgi:hypothetical protein
LPNYLEFEAMQAYDSWYKNNQDNFDEVKNYWAQLVELITTLKEGATIPAAQASISSNDDGGEGETSSPDVAQAARLFAKAVIDTIASATLGLAINFISQLSKASTKIVATIRPPPIFDPLRLFFEHLEMKFGGICQD